MTQSIPLQTICKQILDGQIGAFPCDTVWGIVGIAEPEPIAKALAAKGRGNDSPFILLFPSTHHLEGYIQPISDQQRIWVDQYWPGPVTLVFEALDTVSPVLTGGRGTLACRVPDFPPLNQLLTMIDQPVFSTSLNRHGQAPCQEIQDLDPDLRSTLDFVYSGARPGLGTASTILDCTDPDQIVTLRP